MEIFTLHTTHQMNFMFAVACGFFVAVLFQKGIKKNLELLKKYIWRLGKGNYIYISLTKCPTLCT